MLALLASVRTGVCEPPPTCGKSYVERIRVPRREPVLTQRRLLLLQHLAIVVTHSSYLIPNHHHHCDVIFDEPFPPPPSPRHLLRSSQITNRQHHHRTKITHAIETHRIFVIWSDQNYFVFIDQNYFCFYWMVPLRHHHLSWLGFDRVTQLILLNSLPG